MTTNFDVRIRAAEEAGAYIVEVIGSPDGESPAVRQSAPQLSEEVRTAWQRGALSARAAQTAGAHLYQWLFPAPVAERLLASRRRLESSKEVTRIRLRVEPPELSRLPWELCWNPIDEFMALHPELAWVRYIAEPFAPVALGVPAPLRVVLALASPTDLPALDTEGEKALILESLDNVKDRVQVKVLPHATWEQVYGVLEEGADVFHFVGHGGFGETGEGYLALEQEDGTLNAVAAGQLRVLFRGRDTRLVVLNACQSAVAEGQEALMAVAPSLVRSSAAAVLAQQAPVPDRVAKRFARTLYEYLAKGKAVDEIVTDMRLLAYGANANEAHWGIPVLFMRAPDGKLWQESAGKAVPQEQEPNTDSGGVTIRDISGSSINIGTIVGGDYHDNKKE